MSWGTTRLEHHKAAQAYPLSSPLCFISFPWCSQLMNSRKLQFICKLIAFTFLNWQKKLTLILPGLKQSVNHLYDVTETETPNAFIAISGNVRDETTEAGEKWQESPCWAAKAEVSWPQTCSTDQIPSLVVSRGCSARAATLPLLCCCSQRKTPSKGLHWKSYWQEEQVLEPTVFWLFRI